MMHILPSTLIWLLNVLIVSAQTRQQLSLNSIVSFNSSNGLAFLIPAGPTIVAVTVAVCSQNTDLQFRLSNTGTTDIPSASEGIGLPITLVDGFGGLNATFTNGGVLAVEGRGSFEIGLSDSGSAMHQFLDLPLFGDTTSNQALLFSPPFSAPEPHNPTYPNYTMLPTDIPQLSPPTSFPNYTLSIFQTSSQTFPHTACFVSRQPQLPTGSASLNQSLWLRDEEGWRTQYLVSGLAPSTNYSAFLTLDSAKVAGPIYFATKSASFPCPLVANLPYCPRVAYAMPLPEPPNNAELYLGDTLPEALSGPLRSYLTNFTVSLSSFACGRDLYSPLVSCIDCQREYRKWLCAVSLPRCSEPSPANPRAFTAMPAEPSVTGLSATKDDKQQVLSALLPYQTSTPPRNANLPQFNSPYQMLLPCIETCNSVDRACPPFIGFKCPTAQFNGGASYGIGYIDGKDGDEGEGLTGRSQDQYGNVWCAAG